MYQVGINHEEDSLEHPPSSAAGGRQESTDTVGKEGQSGQTLQERRKRKLPSKVDSLSFFRGKSLFLIKKNNFLRLLS